MDVVERLLAKRRIDGNCWIWTGAKQGSGYGHICITKDGFKRWAGVHRVAYEQWVAPIPPGHDVCHTCDVKLCFNPLHLFAATHAINQADMATKGRAVGPQARKTECKRGHAFTPENTYVNRAGHRVCRPCRRINQRRAP